MPHALKIVQFLAGDLRNWPPCDREIELRQDQDYSLATRSLFADDSPPRGLLNRTGVYILWSDPVDLPGQLPRAYMGEGDVLVPRLDSHAKNKDFWTHGVAFTS